MFLLEELRPDEITDRLRLRLRAPAFDDEGVHSRSGRSTSNIVHANPLNWPFGFSLRTKRRRFETLAWLVAAIETSVPPFHSVLVCVKDSVQVLPASSVGFKWLLRHCQSSSFFTMKKASAPTPSSAHIQAAFSFPGVGRIFPYPIS